MNATHEAVGELEVVSIEGRDLVTLIINGQMFDMSAAVAKVLASDLSKRAKATKGGR